MLHARRLLPVYGGGSRLYDCRGVWLGDGSTCDECDALWDAEEESSVEREACCLPDDRCYRLPVDVCLRRNGIPQGIGTHCMGTDCSIAKAQDTLENWHDWYRNNPVVIVVTSGNDGACTEWLMDTLVESEKLGDCPYMVVDESAFRRLDIETGGFIIASERMRQQLGDIGPMEWISSDGFPGCPRGENEGPGSYQRISLGEDFVRDLLDWSMDVFGSGFDPDVVVFEVGFFDSNESSEADDWEQSDPLGGRTWLGASDFYSLMAEDWAHLAGSSNAHADDGGDSKPGTIEWIKDELKKIPGIIDPPPPPKPPQVDDPEDPPPADKPKSDGSTASSPDGDGRGPFGGDWRTMDYITFLWMQELAMAQTMEDIDSGKPLHDERGDNQVKLQMWFAERLQGEEEKDEDADALEHESLVRNFLDDPRRICLECGPAYADVEDPPRHNQAAIPYMNVSVNSPAVVSTGYITSLAVGVIGVESDAPSSVIEESFEDPEASSWDLGWGWHSEVMPEIGHVLVGTGDDRWGNFAWAPGLQYGENGALMCDILLDYGRAQISYRTGEECSRYFVWFTSGEMGIEKESSCGQFETIAHAAVGLTEDEWHTVAIIGKGGHLSVAVNGQVLLDAVDPNPLLSGSIALETWPNSRAVVDGLVIMDLEMEGASRAGPESTSVSEMLFTTDFEDGDLRGWIVSGSAFANQPTRGDNSAARGREPSNHQGEWWIGGYEDYQGKPGQTPGSAQGDHPTGTLTSAPFVIEGSSLSFLIGGGDHPIGDPSGATVIALVIDDEVIFHATGANTETMRRAEWDVSEYIGQTAVIQIIDENTGDWGHINCDDFQI